MRKPAFCCLAALALAASSPVQALPLAGAAPGPFHLDGPIATKTVAGPKWARNLSIYEVNLDVYGFPKGTALREYEKQLPVLKEMGVGIVWFMPIYPRGQKKAFGSPYAVRDYRDINPDLGTKEDFRHLIKRAHELGLRVMLDWVPNHTSWDNALIDSHPEFYVKNEKGEISQASTWFDVAQLDYGKPGQWNRPLWNLMRDDMAFWIREYDIDGFRCDAAGRSSKIPGEFWNWLRPQLNSVKPVLMLAEGDDPYLHPAFDMTYEWDLPRMLWDICFGRKPASAIDDELRRESTHFPDGSVMMRFLDNHDWHHNADWLWGDRPAVDMSGGLPQIAPMMVLCTTLPGKPLVYNGQEMSFVRADPPRQAEARYKSPVWPFYSHLLRLYQSQPALSDGSLTRIPSDRDEKVYAFIRQRGANRVLVVVNLSAEPQDVTLQGASLAGKYRDWFGDSAVTLGASPSLKLGPWGYSVYVTNVK